MFLICGKIKLGAFCKAQRGNVNNELVRMRKEVNVDTILCVFHKARGAAHITDVKWETFLLEQTLLVTPVNSVKGGAAGLKFNKQLAFINSE